jgi:hypothetical protein
VLADHDQTEAPWYRTGKGARMQITGLTTLIKYIPVLIAAILLGNWFLAEVRKSRAAGAPWYQPYQSLPGILIIVILIIPIILWLLR